jgi:TetR/AcrR family transcriptional regulator
MAEKQTAKRNRREEILQSLALMLESSDGSQRITTAKLAASVGVSEAALYRHFPSKTRMFDSLIEFIEDSLITRINLILKDEKDTSAPGDGPPAGPDAQRPRLSALCCLTQ